MRCTALVVKQIITGIQNNEKNADNSRNLSDPNEEGPFPVVADFSYLKDLFIPVPIVLSTSLQKAINSSRLSYVYMFYQKDSRSQFWQSMSSSLYESVRIKCI